MCDCVCAGDKTFNGESVNLCAYMENQLAETHQMEPFLLQRINTLAVNPYLPTCNLYAHRCTHGLSGLCWNADSTEIWILIWLRFRVEALSSGGEVEGKGLEGGGWGLPVALAPTGSNLEQTAPNVFIRLWLGWAQVGRACPAWRWIVLIVPSIKCHLFQWGNEGKRERVWERQAEGRKRELLVKSHVLWCLDNFVY